MKSSLTEIHTQLNASCLFNICINTLIVNNNSMRYQRWQNCYVLWTSADFGADLPKKRSGVKMSRSRTIHIHNQQLYHIQCSIKKNQILLDLDAAGSDLFYCRRHGKYFIFFTKYHRFFITLMFFVCLNIYNW